MTSCPASGPHKLLLLPEGLYLSHLPTFQGLSYLERKQKKQFSTLAFLLFVLMPPFTEGPFDSQKNSKDPWEMRTERCSATYGMACCGKIGHLSIAVQSIRCSSPGNQARCCRQRCPGKAGSLRDDSIGVSSFRAREG